MRTISICAYCALNEKCDHVHYEKDFSSCDEILPEILYVDNLSKLRDEIRMKLYGNTNTKNSGIISAFWLYDCQKHEGLFKAFNVSTPHVAEDILWDMVERGLTERQGGGFVF